MNTIKKKKKREKKKIKQSEKKTNLINKHTPETMKVVQYYKKSTTKTTK